MTTDIEPFVRVNMAVAFLSAVFGRMPADAILTLCTKAPYGGLRTLWHAAGDLEAMAREAIELSEQGDVWFGIASRRERLGSGRGGAVDCALVPGLFADIDVEGPTHKANKSLPPTFDAAYELLASFPIESTLVVETGGGLQPYWVFDEPMEVGTDLKAMLDDFRLTWANRAGERGWAIDNVFEPARLLRCVGTFNRKVEPILVTFHGIDFTEDLL